MWFRTSSWIAQYREIGRISVRLINNSLVLSWSNSYWPPLQASRQLIDRCTCLLKPAYEIGPRKRCLQRLPLGAIEKNVLPEQGMVTFLILTSQLITNSQFYMDDEKKNLWRPSNKTEKSSGSMVEILLDQICVHTLSTSARKRPKSYQSVKGANRKEHSKGRIAAPPRWLTVGRCSVAREGPCMQQVSPCLLSFPNPH